MNFGELATASAGTSGSITMTRDAAPRRRHGAPRDAAGRHPALDRVARGRPDGPIGVRLYYVMCWTIFTGSALQWLFLG